MKNKVCSTGIVDIHGKCVEPIEGIPLVLLPLIAEARKYKTFEEFSRAVSIHGINGRYWHITNNPNFKILETTPANATMESTDLGPGLFVTSDPECWCDDYYCSKREFAAEIDLARAIPHKDYSVGFSNAYCLENFISNLDVVSVKKVMPIKQVFAEAKTYEKAVEQFMTSERKAKIFWRKANATVTA